MAVYELFTFPELDKEALPEVLLYFYQKDGKYVATAGSKAGLAEDSEGKKYFVCLTLDITPSSPRLFIHKASGRLFFKKGYDITNEISYNAVSKILWGDMCLDKDTMIDSLVHVWKSDNVKTAAEKLGLWGKEAPMSIKPSIKYSWTLSSSGVNHAV